ncbi:Ceramide synthase 4 [Chytridiales sp. JEL 0842]|nr:Ceramide synthase 4 [Chytridiales sp. JEL 0842]
MSKAHEVQLGAYVDVRNDLQLVILFLLMWAVAHGVFMLLVKPISNALVPEDPVKSPSTPSPPTPTTGPTPKTSTSSTLRQRPTAQTVLAPSPTTPTTLKKKPKTTDRTKFNVSAWKLFTYGFQFVLGLYVLKDEPWIFTPRLYFEGFPELHVMRFEMKVYYLGCFASYLYQTLLLGILPKQKDFFAMIVHHLATLFLIGMSYTYGLFRVGAVILILHDAADPFMEIAKCFLYCRMQRFADSLFILFAIVFITTRNIIFPFYVIRSTFLYCVYPDGQAMPFGKWEIIKMIIKALVDKKVEGDVRDSDDDE